MYVRMMFSVGVALLVTLLLPSSTTGLDQDRDKANDLIFYIKSRHYEDAAYLIKRGFNKTMEQIMNYVVHEVYNGDKTNADLILEYVDSNYTNNTGVNALISLVHEMNAENHTDYLLKLRVMKRLNAKSSTRVLQDLNRDLKNSVKKPLENELINAVKSKDNAKIYYISEIIHDNSPALFKELIKTVLKKTLNNINHYDLLHVFEKLKHIPQRVWFYSAMFNELQNFDVSVLVFLALGLKQSLVGKLDLEAYKEASRVIRKLPHSVHSLAITDAVCITNKRFEQPMYGASGGFNEAPDRRSVYTFQTKEFVSQGKWIIEREGDSFFIKNSRGLYNASEYLFAPGEAKQFLGWEEENTKVYTKIDGEIPKEHNIYKWIFEPIGDGVYIKNVGQNQYLNVMGDRRDDYRLYVYIGPKTDLYWSNIEWIIDDCSAISDNINA